MHKGPTGPVYFDAVPEDSPPPVPPGLDDKARKEREAWEQRVQWQKEFEEKLPIGVSNDPYFYVRENTLTKEQCAQIIQKYESEPQYQYKGVTGNGYSPSMKKTREIHISRTLTWKEQDALLCQVLQRALSEYAIKTATLCNNLLMLKTMKTGNSMDTGYQLQKYDKGEGVYHWHHDYVINSEDSSRKLTFLWYLNDVEEGGETMFYHGKIKPKAGTLVIFPATWTYNHKGAMPLSSDKYVVTGWVSNKSAKQKTEEAQAEDAEKRAEDARPEELEGSHQVSST